jgi:hypothetical protein
MTQIFQGHGKVQEKYLQSEVLEFKIYHHVLKNTKSQADFDCLSQLHALDKTEQDKIMV